MAITVFLADDQPLIIYDLRSLIETDPHYMVIGDAYDGLQALREIERLQPDIAMLDLVMPGLGGLEIARQIRERGFHTRTLILTMYSDETFVQEALKIGVYGYILKGGSPLEILEALDQVITGRKYLCSQIRERAVQNYIQRAKKAPQDEFDELTAREREVLSLAAQGMTNAEIAKCLSISRRTVESYRANLMRKLGLSNQKELILYAIQQGILVVE